MTDAIEFVLTARNASDAAFAAFNRNLSEVELNAAKVSAGIGAAIVAVGALELHFADMAEQLQDNALILDVNAQTLREWTHNAVTAGIQGDQFVGMLEKLAKNAGEAAGGNKALLAEFAKLGISQVDLLTRFKDMNALFPAYIDGLRGMGDGFDQVATNVALAGRAANPLIEIIRSSPDDIRAQTEAFRENAGVLTDEQIDALAQAKEAWNSLLDTIEQRGLSVFAQITVAVKQASEDVTAASEEYTRAKLQERLADLKKELADVNTIKVAGSEWELFWQKVAGLQSKLMGGDPETAAKGKLERIQQAIQDAMAQLIGPDLDRLFAGERGGGSTGGGGGADIATAIFGDGYSVAQLEQDVADMIAAQDNYRIAAEQLQNDIGRHRSANQTAELRAIADETAINDLRIDGAQRAADAIQSIEDKARSQRRLSDAAAFADMVANATQGHKSLFAISKAAAIASAIINTYKAAESSYAFGAEIGGPYVGAAMAAVAVAAGLANIATIASTNFGSTAPAVSTAGPGGFGTANAQPLPPDVATPASAQQQGTVNLVVTAGDDSELSRALVKMISVEVQQNDAVLFRSDSRQAAELRA